MNSLRIDCLLCFLLRFSHCAGFDFTVPLGLHFSLSLSVQVSWTSVLLITSNSVEVGKKELFCAVNEDGFGGSPNLAPPIVWEITSVLHDSRSSLPSK
jgi:hypothetical protein